VSDIPPKDALKPGTPSENYAALEDWIASFRRRWRGAMCLRGIMVLAAASGLVCLILFAGDNVARFPAWVRTSSLAASVIMFACGAAVLVVKPLILKLNNEIVAARAEKLIPGLENSVINAVQFHKAGLSALERDLADAQLSEAAARAREIRPRNPGDWRAIRKPGLAALVLSATFLAYAILLPRAFGNAWARFWMPWKYVPPLTDTRLEITPGDAEILIAESLLVEAAPRGVIPEQATIVFKDQRGEKREKMAFEGGAFVFQFAALASDVRYRVEAGDAVSRNYTIKVKPRPFIESLKILCEFPDYLGLPPIEQEGRGGDIQAVTGTKVSLSIRSDSPIRAAVWRFFPERGAGDPGSPDVADASAPATDNAEEILMELAGEREASCRFELRRNGAYQIEATGKAGTPSPPLIHSVLALPDNPPRCEIVLPGRDASIPPDQKFPVHARATDDYGVRTVELLLSDDGKQWRVGDSRSFPPGGRALTEAFEIDPASLGLEIGQNILYCVRTGDGLERQDENAGRSIVYRLSIASDKADQKISDSDMESLETGIRRLIKKQTEAQDKALILSKWSEKDGAETDAAGKQELLADRCAAVVLEQSSVRDETRALVQRHAPASESAKGAALEARKSAMIQVLAGMADGEMEDAWRKADALRKTGGGDATRNAAGELMAVQKTIIEKLKALLGAEEDALASLLAAKKEEIGGETVDRDAARKLAEELLQKIAEYKEEQKKTFEATRALEKKPVEDFTEADLAAIKEAQQTEAKWAKYFEEKVTDFSKLPPQDFADSAVAKELFEIWCEVKLAEDAFTRKTVEMAVPHEQSGLELAESLETNLEKWLMDVKDFQKWNMEEPTQDYDVPIVDLPDELEDLIGELLDSEESMTEDLEDVTSGWMDSIDKGAGWGTMDGPISNMSAQGKTGNLLPNQQEIGGRSGEGRSGKSSGQFVEETATGKGGRDTPTRLTPDPFEEGRVQDTSTDPVSGSTGGGRASGDGQEGLRGPAPPQVAEQLVRLAQKQAEIVNKAESLDHGLKVYRYPRGGLPQAIGEMRQTEEDMKAGRLRDYSRTQKVVLGNLREVKDAVERQKSVNRDTGSALPKQMRTEIVNSLSEKAPEKYKDMLGDYYKALTESR